jgi:hypothetical protein
MSYILGTVPDKDGTSQSRSKVKHDMKSLNRSDITYDNQILPH